MALAYISVDVLVAMSAGTIPEAEQIRFQRGLQHRRSEQCPEALVHHEVARLRLENAVDDDGGRNGQQRPEQIGLQAPGSRLWRKRL